MASINTKTYVYTNQEEFGFIDILGNDDTSVEQVDFAMKQMDKKFHTQFYSWIRNENNVDYISYYLRRVITEYEKASFPAIKRAIQWLVDGWSVQRTAELLIKLFYHWGIGDAKFAGLVLQVTRHWQVQPALVDLVITLVIGERSSKTARFLHHLTGEWSATKIADLVGAIALRLRWTERYCKHFLLQLACLGDQPWEKKRLLVNDIRYQFSQRRLSLNTNPLASNPPPEALVSFTLKLLYLILNPNLLESTSLPISDDLDMSPLIPKASLTPSSRSRIPPPVLTSSPHPHRRPPPPPTSTPNTPYCTRLPDDPQEPLTPQPSPCPNSSKVLAIS